MHVPPLAQGLEAQSSISATKYNYYKYIYCLQFSRPDVKQTLANNSQSIIFNKQNLLCEQLAPVHPVAHVQLNAFRRSIHVPPF